MVSEKSVGEFPNLFITFYFYDISEMLKKYKITRESRRIYKFFGITCYILKSRRNLSQGSVKTWNYFKKKRKNGFASINGENAECFRVFWKCVYKITHKGSSLKYRQKRVFHFI